MQLFDCKYICSHLTAQIYFLRRESKGIVIGRAPYKQDADLKGDGE